MSAVASSQSNLVSNQSNRAPEEEDPEYEEEEEETYEDEEKNGGSGMSLLAGGGGVVALAAIAAIVICIFYSGVCNKQEQAASAPLDKQEQAAPAPLDKQEQAAPAPLALKDGTVTGAADTVKGAAETEVQETMAQRIRRRIPTPKLPKVSAQNPKFSGAGVFGVIMMIGAGVAYFFGFGRTAPAGVPSAFRWVSPTAAVGVLGGVAAISSMAGCCYNRNAGKEVVTEEAGAGPADGTQ